jgi:DNA-3-methyladenine glycosylase
VVSPKKALTQKFFSQHAVVVAQALIGKVFVFEHYCARIVETECYRNGDGASHSAVGKTLRNQLMFGPPGVVYVYFIYGVHCMLNFVVEPINDPAAILIRGIEPLNFQSERTKGPGMLCKTLGITLKDNGQSLLGPRFLVLDDGYCPVIHCSARVGIRKNKEALWRFFEFGNQYVSVVKENKQSVRVPFSTNEPTAQTH